MEIPWQSLSPDALDGLIEEFVSREGTDYGDAANWSLGDKVAAVRAQLASGEARIDYDPDADTTTILATDT